MESPANVEDHGDWLSSGMSHAGSVIPVRISRAAMEEQVDASQRGSLKKAYVLDAGPVTGPVALFFRKAHRGGCRYFKGVLGPDYNTAHRDHFHLEAVGYRMCR